nr:putative capsid protein [Crucivirus sp.]
MPAVKKTVKRPTRVYKAKPRAKPRARRPRRVDYDEDVAIDMGVRSPGMLSKGGSALGTAAGGALGGPAGAAIGNFLGGKLGHLVEHVTGFGDYSISSNSILQGGLSPPQVINSIDKGGVIVRHREYIRDIPATVDFTSLKFPLNPGQASTFPWLSQMAANFEQYRFRGLLFEYISTSSDAILSSSTSTALGTVSIATDYDVLDIAYTDKRTMLNAEFSTSSKPSMTFIHPIECKKSISPMALQYIRTTLNFPANSDARMYDLANTFVATEGMQAAAGNVGELWVTYEVELYKQQSNFIAYTDHWQMSNMTSASLLGTVQSSIDAGGSIGGAVNGPGTAYSFPPELSSGKFLCYYYAAGSAAATLGNLVPTITKGSLAALWRTDNWTSVQIPAPGVSSAFVSLAFIVQINAPGCIITFPTAVIPTTSVFGDFYITQIANSIVD